MLSKVKKILACNCWKGNRSHRHQFIVKTQNDRTLIPFLPYQGNHQTASLVKRKEKKRNKCLRWKQKLNDFTVIEMTNKTIQRSRSSQEWFKKCFMPWIEVQSQNSKEKTLQLAQRSNQLLVYCTNKRLVQSLPPTCNFFGRIHFWALFLLGIVSECEFWRFLPWLYYVYARWGSVRR